MGWLFMSEMRKKSQLIEHLCPKSNTLAKSLKGSTLWAVKQAEGGKRYIMCFLLGKDRGAWGYKDMDESRGPVYDTCPVDFFDLVPDPGGFATGFRALCRERAEREALAAKVLRVGAVVKLKSGLSIQGEAVTEATIECVRPLIGRVLVNGLFPRSVSIKRAWLA